MDVRPFKIDLGDEVLDDLRHRLETVRWPDEIPGSGWDYGSNLDYMKELVEYWRTEFDWRAQEAALNAFTQFKSSVDGMDIHFVHERGRGPNPMPLVITHGWPSTFFEMHKIIPMLADPGANGGDPADAFDVVAPSLPGYGFSDLPAERGLETQRVAAMWDRLMTENLGYPRYAVHGGDIGGLVASRLGHGQADHLFGIHVNYVPRPEPYLGPGSRKLTVAEEDAVEQSAVFQRDEGGYRVMQGTKPQTLSYGLNDSPVGLAAWIVEKFRSWSDCDGDVARRFTKDELLTNITIYWVTQTINSSVRMYYESFRKPWAMGKGEIIPAPAAVAVFPAEHDLRPREWADRSYNVQRWTPMPAGGHFAAMEEPALLAADIRAFFRSYRTVH
jgi:pimeloyl-ACP methyl ester carboxylesterase